MDNNENKTNIIQEENANVEEEVAYFHNKPNTPVLKLIVGIFSIVLFVIMQFQSCGVTLLSSITSPHDTGWALGFMLSFIFLITGIVSVALRNNPLQGMVFNGVACCIGWLLTATYSGIYTDLSIWSFISLTFGVIYLQTLCKNKKTNIMLGIFWIVMLIINLFF